MGSQFGPTQRSSALLVGVLPLSIHLFVPRFIHLIPAILARGSDPDHGRPDGPD